MEFELICNPRVVIGVIRLRHCWDLAFVAFDSAQSLRVTFEPKENFLHWMDHKYVILKQGDQIGLIFAQWAWQIWSILAKLGRVLKG
jgi:hypothetical protein